MDASPVRDDHASDLSHVGARALDVELLDRLTYQRFGASNNVTRARALGISRETLLRLRRHSHAPTLATASRLAGLLGVSIEELFPSVAGA